MTPTQAQNLSYQSTHGSAGILNPSSSSLLHSLVSTAKSRSLTCSRDEDSNLHFAWLDLALDVAVHTQGPVCLQGPMQIEHLNVVRA